jgi:plastocyanin
MASIDKIGMAVAIVIVAIFLGIAASMSAAQDAGPAVSTPKPVVVEKPAEQVIELEEEIAMEETSEEETMMEESAGPTTVHVEIPEGTSVPGCEETNECWSPADVTINAGDTVHWMNVDTAAHTVTGGSPADGPSGVFDSSLVMIDATYEFTFDDAGSYDYFCMVHPWMVGSVTVN